MVNYENVKLKQLTHFCVQLAEAKLNNLGYLKRRFLEQFIYFDETLEFLLYYNIIKVENKNIIFTSKMRKYIHSLDARIREDDLRRFFLILVLTENNDIEKEIFNFLDKFKFIDNRYEFKPVGKERAESAALRNFLIDFGIIDLYRDQIKYFIPEYVTFYLQIEKRSSGLSEKQFEALLLSRKKMGRKAEIEVLNYERNRLKDRKEYLNKIEHTALHDVGAGYDIKSFDVLGAEIVPRFIEVKATSILYKKFFWSNNEIQCAQRNRNKYYLYLVPIGENSDILINKIEIIQDPYIHILNDKKNWLGDVELMSFRKILINDN